MSEKKKQWNIQNIPEDLDKKVRIHLIENNDKLYSFILKAVQSYLEKSKKEG